MYYSQAGPRKEFFSCNAATPLERGCCESDQGLLPRTPAPMSPSRPGRVLPRSGTLDCLYCARLLPPALLAWRKIQRPTWEGRLGTVFRGRRTWPTAAEFDIEKDICARSDRILGSDVRSNCAGVQQGNFHRGIKEGSLYWCVKMLSLFWRNLEFYWFKQNLFFFFTRCLAVNIAIYISLLVYD